MPNYQFVCKHCGFIIEDPEIMPQPDLLYGEPILPTTHYAVSCPICRKRTQFERGEPFPTDASDDDSILRLTLTANTRFGKILQENLDRARAAGMNVKGIELPKLSEFNGIPIRYY